MVCVQCYSNSQPSDVIEVCYDYQFTPDTTSWSGDQDIVFEEFIDTKDSVFDHVSHHINKKIVAFLCPFLQFSDSMQICPRQTRRRRLQLQSLLSLEGEYHKSRPRLQHRVQKMPAGWKQVYTNGCKMMFMYHFVPFFTT